MIGCQLYPACCPNAQQDLISESVFQDEDDGAEGADGQNTTDAVNVALKKSIISQVSGWCPFCLTNRCFA